MGSPITMGGCWKTRKDTNDLALGTVQMYLAGTGASRALRCDANCVKVLRNARKSTRIMCFLVDDLVEFFCGTYHFQVQYSD